MIHLRTNIFFVLSASHFALQGQGLLLPTQQVVTKDAVIEATKANVLSQALADTDDIRLIGGLLGISAPESLHWLETATKNKLQIDEKKTIVGVELKDRDSDSDILAVKDVANKLTGFNIPLVGTYPLATVNNIEWLDTFAVDSEKRVIDDFEKIHVFIQKYGSQVLKTPEVGKLGDQIEKELESIAKLSPDSFLNGVKCLAMGMKNEVDSLTSILTESIKTDMPDFELGSAKRIFEHVYAVPSYVINKLIKNKVNVLIDANKVPEKLKPFFEMGLDVFSEEFDAKVTTFVEDMLKHAIKGNAHHNATGAAAHTGTTTGAHAGAHTGAHAGAHAGSKVVASTVGKTSACKLVAGVAGKFALTSLSVIFVKALPLAAGAVFTATVVEGVFEQDQKQLKEAMDRYVASFEDQLEAYDYVSDEKWLSKYGDEDTITSFLQRRTAP